VGIPARTNPPSSPVLWIHPIILFIAIVTALELEAGAFLKWRSVAGIVKRWQCRAVLKKRFALQYSTYFLIQYFDDERGLIIPFIYSAGSTLLLTLTVAAMDARFRGMFLASVGFLFASVGFTLVSADGFVQLLVAYLEERAFCRHSFV
jgi:hypothetical protein